MSEFDKVELESTYAMLKDIYTLRTSILSALAVANVTAIGYALTSQLAIVFLLGCVLTGVALILENIIGRLYLAVLYRGMWLTEQYSQNTESLFATIIIATQREGLYTSMVEAVRISEPDKRRSELTKMARGLARFRTWRGTIITWLWIAALLTQLLAIPFLHYILNWKLF